MKKKSDENTGRQGKTEQHVQEGPSVPVGAPDSAAAPASLSASADLGGQGVEGGHGKNGGHGKAEDAAKIAELEDRLLRLRADFDNYRKRTLRDRDDLSRRANEDLMLEILPVLDHLNLAVEAAKAHKANGVFLDGLRVVAEQMAAALGKFGLKPIETAGAQFDPAIHEAISHLPSPDVPENKVMAEARKGYLLGDRLLRASQVVVSSGPYEPPEPAGECDD